MIEGKGKIAVLTSGGDAPGMNAAIRAPAWGDIPVYCTQR